MERPNPLNEMEAVYMDWSTASKTQLFLITSTYENCPLWLKTEAREELMRKQKTNPHQDSDAEEGEDGVSNLAVHFSSETVVWETPQDFFDRLDAEFHFELDVCANDENAKCRRYFTERENGLLQNWTGNVWMNPPYGREIAEWVQKAYESSQEGATVVCLIPSRTDAGWWHDYCMKGEIRFVRGRLKFGGSEWNAPFPSAVVIFRNQPYDNRQLYIF